MLFTSKANTLLYLSDKITAAEVLPLKIIQYSDWKQDYQKSTDEIISLLGNKPTIVRSSCAAEDSVNYSMAGVFTSILNICNKEQLQSAIDEVYLSYSHHLTNDSQVLVQPMLDEVLCSGVAFTKDPNNGGDYYVVNYAPDSDDTESVTSGRARGLQVDYWFKGHPTVFSGWRAKIHRLLVELQHECQSEELDVEFGITRSGKVYLFQVRPLIIEQNLDRGLYQEQKAQLRQVSKKIARLSQRHPHLCGEKTVFANMPDWNPAEIIGTRPSTLALSLYKELVTDSIWAKQREAYGYKNLSSFPLLVSFAQSPYIDVRVSFNSFLPQELNASLSEKLVNYYIEQLLSNPTLQDKVEFEIVVSCRHFGLEKRLESLKECGFSNAEIDELTIALTTLTNNIIAPESTILANDFAKIEELKQRQVKIRSSSLNKIEKIYWLLEDCKTYGTLAFAGIARAAFIAKQFIVSLVSEGIFSPQRAENFLNSMNSISTKMLQELQNMDTSSFLAKYGHLRPGTYDITSLRYDEMPEEALHSSPLEVSETYFELTPKERNDVARLIEGSKLAVSVDQLFEFFRKSIEGRENAKFEFSRSISEVLRLIQEFGADIGYSTEELSYLNIQDVRMLYSESLPARDTFKASISKHKKHLAVCRSLLLPPVISRPEDVFVFTLSEGQPNFITRLRVKAETECDLSASLQDKIVFIPSADPGYDWLFSHKIAGFITMYGGVNSHMSIRACELGIPAIVGAGELLYNKWKSYVFLSLDCEQGKVECL